MSGCLKNIHFADGINVERNGDGIIASISSGMMYVEDWDRVFSTWTLTSDSLTAIFIDYDESTIQTFGALVTERPSRVLQPLLMEYLFINRLFVGFHNRQTDEINSMYEFEWSTAECTFEEGLKRLTSIITKLGVLRSEVRWWQSAITQLERCECLFEELASRKKSSTQALYTIPGCKYIKFYQQYILNEIDNTERRTHTQLTLMMHRINIDESRANQRLGQQSKELAEQSKELGELTAILARQTSADSASMITIAVMTMFFLPATFISSLFSIGFFVFDDSGALSVSNVVWIYPAITIPLTFTVFATWLVWIKFGPNKMETVNKLLDEKLKQNHHETADQVQP